MAGSATASRLDSACGPQGHGRHDDPDLTPANPGQSDGFDINSSGIVVGWVRHNPVTMRGAVWMPDKARSTELGAFSSSTNAESGARWVNDAGQVAGYAQSVFETDDGDPIFHAFSWTASGGLVDANTALGINNKKGTDALGLTETGKVLVYVQGSFPVLWTPGGGGLTVTPPDPASVQVLVRDVSADVDSRSGATPRRATRTPSSGRRATARMRSLCPARCRPRPGASTPRARWPE